MKDEYFKYVIWLILETLVRIMISVVIILILSRYIDTLVLSIIILLFAWWCFGALRSAFSFYREYKSKRKRKK